MTDKQVMQQALDALNESVDLVIEEHRQACDLYSGYPARHGKVEALKIAAELHTSAIAALNAAIAQPVQPVQPAAYTDANGDLFSVGSHEKFGYGSIPLYAHPPIAQPAAVGAVEQDAEIARLREALTLLYAVYCSQMKSEYDFPSRPWTPERDCDEAALLARAALTQTGAEK